MPAPATGMKRYVIRRLLLLPVILIGMTILTFAVSHFVPTDPVVAALGAKGSTNDVAYANYKKKFGLDDPLPVQYYKYVDAVVHGDLGTSTSTQDPVTDDLREFFPATVELAIAALLIAMIIGIPTGIFAAATRGSPAEGVVKGFAMVGISSPAFVVGFIAYQVFYVRLGWVGGSGSLGVLTQPPHRVTGMITIDAIIGGNYDAFTDSLRHLVLPACILGFVGAAYFSRVVRQTMIDALDSEAIRTARGKGMGATVVLFRHAFRLGLTTTLSYTGLYIGELFAGAITVEAITGWPGIGQYMYNAAVKLDFPAVMGGTLLIGVVYIIVNLIVDLLYARFDPRVRLS
jgi:peptide/nickel transport system permease protein